MESEAAIHKRIMIAKPSIAFNDFAGTAKDVTARTVNGRNVLSVRAKQSKVVTPAQANSRNQLSKISREYKQLSDSQMQAWEVLAKHLKGVTYFGKAAAMTGHNAFVRINVNRQLAGEPLLLNAPSHLGSIPNVEYADIYITPDLVTITGIRHKPNPFKLVIKMSACQSAGVSSGWGKTVIISSNTEDDWGEADVTELYLKKLGVAATPGQKVFIESYWMNTNTGIAGQVFKDSVICTETAPYTRRVKVTMDDLKPDVEQHVSSLDVDFSTNAPAVYFDSVCLGHSNVASSEATLDQPLPSDCIGIFMALGRGMGEDGSLHPQSYEIQTTNGYSETKIRFMHRGGKYIKPTEVFGPGVCYPNS